MTSYTAGTETPVNTVTVNGQTPNYHAHNVVGLIGGGFVDVWQSVAGFYPDGTTPYYDIEMQRFDNLGNKVGTETRVNTSTGDNHTLPQVTNLLDGGYIVVWTGYGTNGDGGGGNNGGGGIYAQRYDASGNKVGGESLVNTTVAAEQDTPSVLGLPDGGYLVTWDSFGQDGDRYGEYAQRYDFQGNKAGGELHVSSNTVGTQDSSALALYKDNLGGGLVIVYNNATAFDTNGFATNYDIVAQRVGVLGLSAPVVVNTTTAGNQDFASVATMADGGYLVTWVDYSEAGSSEIRAQRFTGSGVAVGGEVTVNTTATGDAEGTSVTTLLDGGYVVSWSMSTGNGTNATDYNVFLQRYDAAGNKVGTQTEVNTATDGNQIYSSVTVLSDGSYVVSYRSPDSSANGIFDKIYYLDQVINDQVSGGHSLTGGYGSDTINGLDGNDTLDGGNGPGLDTLNGGDGNDTIKLQGGDKGYGGAGDDTFVVTHLNAQNFYFEGGDGTDIVDATTMDGPPTWIFTNSQSVEEYRAGAFGDTVNASTVTNVPIFTFNGGAGNDVVYSGSGTDFLNGGGGNDYLDGGLGGDKMTGGDGNDTYVVDNVNDRVVESSTGGTDTVRSSIAFTLNGLYVENLTLTGSANVNATGNSGNNILIGNAGNNAINGGGGDDTMSGGAGNDTFTVDSVTDSVSENLNEGIDTVQSTIGYSLGANLENLTLLGTAVSGVGNALDNTILGNGADNSLSGGDGNDTLNGASGIDTLTGGAGNDMLDGGAGADKMNGGAGDDTYVVENAGDTVTEGNNQGNDTVNSYVNWSLIGSYVENVVLLGNGAINATGNALDNHLTGNANINILNGYTGDDTMTGGKGNDVYYVDTTGDTIVELLNEGNDTVYSQINYTLGANLDNLFLSGSDNLNATGNELVNILIGNGGNNTLSGMDGNDVMHGYGGNDTMDGGSGADRMYGGAGNDTYIVDNAADGVSEQSTNGVDDGGIDLVNASVSYALSGFVENLTLTGTGNINGAGNDIANVIVGNSGSNILTGGAGDDTLTGGAGSDTFNFAPGSGQDKITDFHASENDHINLHAYNAQSTTTFTQSGADTLIHLPNGNVITVQNTSHTDAQFLSHIIW